MVQPDSGPALNGVNHGEERRGGNAPFTWASHLAPNPRQLSLLDGKVKPA